MYFMVYYHLISRATCSECKTLLTIVFLKKKITITKPYSCQNYDVNFSETCEICPCKNK